MVGVSTLHEIVNAAGALNEFRVDLFVFLAPFATINVVAPNRITGRITRRYTRVPRKPYAMRPG